MTHAVRRILAAGGVSHVVVVTPATHESDFDEALAEFDPTLVTRVGGGADLAVALALGLGPDPGVDVGQRARHVAGAQRLAAGGFHRLVQLASHVALRHVS